MNPIPADKFIVLIAAIIAPVFTAGAAWMAVKSALNGTRADVREIKGDLKTLITSDADQNERLVAIEAVQEAQHGWIERLEEWLRRLERIIDRRGEER